MTRTLVFIYFMGIGAVCAGQGFQKAYAEARTAYKQKDFALFYQRIKEANTLHPYHQEILYQLGIAAALNQHPDEAVENLKKALLINADYSLDIPDLVGLESKAEFVQLKRLQLEWQKSVIHSDTALVIGERDLHAEGIGFNPDTKSFYVGSIHKRKILQVSEDGSTRDFCPSGFMGMTSVFGVRVDQKKNILWACASPVEEMVDYDTAAKSAVFKFELSSGKFLKKYEIKRGSKGAIFGDLVLSRTGEVYVSDSKNNRIFVLGKDDLTSFFSSPEFWNIQGIAFSPDEKYLFIADYVKGIYRLEMKSKSLTKISTDADISLKGIDGLYFYENTLIAVQNGTNPLRCTRYFLNNSQDKIKDFKILDRKHPAFGEPTTGVLDGRNFYYIANSQWDGYAADHSIKSWAELKDIIVLRYILN